MTNQPLSTTDRLLRALFVACAVGVCWAIRGTFGHALGAMAPGAALGLGFAYVSKQRAMYRWMPAMGLVTAVLIGQGGQMSYLLILVGSAFVNGEKTMQSANTRFPLWSWRDGPPSE